MKKLILIVFLFSILFTSKTFSQNYRFEISEVAMSVKQDGKWSPFTPFREAKIVATLDSKKNLIAVYSELVQFYRIYEYNDKVSVGGKDIVSFNCTDQDGEKCRVEIHTRKSNNTNQLYVRHQGRILVYNMKYTK